MYWHLPENNISYLLFRLDLQYPIRPSSILGVMNKQTLSALLSSASAMCMYTNVPAIRVIAHFVMP